MSGIFGFSLPSANLAGDYLNRLSHWNRCYGHEGSFFHVEGGIGIGCHTEHISDKYPAPKQVLHRGKLIAVIDAILYNRSELLHDLSLVEEYSVSDEDLLIDFVLKYGFDSLSRVNGDFAGAIYDQSSNEWTLFRDHSGVRPLFYYADKECLIFSTDIRAILAINEIDRSINKELLYLRATGYNELSLCETQYRNIHCICPASWTTVTHCSNQLHMNSHIYWKWGRSKVKLRSNAQYQKELRSLITDAVKRRMDAFPGFVGCELSGGLDSSIIAILINRLGRKGCFYSWSFSPEDIAMNDMRDERQVIMDICEQEGIECSFARLSEGRQLPELLAEMLPPYVNTRSISYGSQKLRSMGARVVFSGHGGDEGVSHRGNSYEMWYHHEYHSFLKMQYERTKGRSFRLLRTLKYSWNDIQNGKKRANTPFYKQFSNASAILDPGFVNEMAPVSIRKPLPFSYDPIAYILQGGHRVRLDNVAVQGAEKGVRYMLPFIDYRVLDFALSIPRAQYKTAETNRAVYRSAFRDIMPQSLCDVHYKDMPSLEKRERTINPVKQFEESISLIRDNLDREFWRGILNFEYIDNAVFPEQATPVDYSMASAVLNELSICCAIEYALKHAPEVDSSEVV